MQYAFSSIASSHPWAGLVPLKVPDIYDCAKYDVTHNFAVLGEPAALVEVHDHVKRLAMLVVPLEYGSTLKVMTCR